MSDNKRSGLGAPQFLSRVVHVDDIPAKGLEGEIEANARQRAAITDALDLERLDALKFAYSLRRSGKGGVKLDGNLTAACTQRCVITLEPVEARLSEEVSLRFLPAEEIARLEQREGEAHAEIDLEGPEPIEYGAIDLGQLAYEIFVSALDPYPRKPAASFDWQDAQDQDADGPFAALESLKRDKK
jgi:uncharacterized metal-binding protein YceD (DUF177 family)